MDKKVKLHKESGQSISMRRNRMCKDLKTGKSWSFSRSKKIGLFELKVVNYERKGSE